MCQHALKPGCSLGCPKAGRGPPAYIYVALEGIQLKLILHVYMS